MKNATKINGIQKGILEVYKEVKRVCEKNKIPFFALAGTELGAIRHKGFIPWDDDIDLGIKVGDYERFKKACRKDLEEPYEFKEIVWLGGKVHNKNTAFVEAPCAVHRENGYGFFVDIFPLIGAPDDENERFGFLNNMLLYSFQAMIFDRYPEISKYTKKQIMDWRNDILYKYPLEKSERFVEFSLGHWYTGNARGLDKAVEMPFEDTMIPVPSTYDEDLTAHYGDYMKLPPVEQRATHNNLAYVDLENSYTKYYDELEKLDPKFLEFLKQKHTFEGQQMLNAAHFRADGNVLRRELEHIKSSRTYRLAKKAQKLVRK